MKPRNMLPVSPMKMRAGWKLKTRNPRTEPDSVQQISDSGMLPL